MKRKLPDPRTLPSPSVDTMKVGVVAVDLDSPDLIKDFAWRVLYISSFLVEKVDEVVVERGGKGWHVLFYLSEPVTLRDNLALRLYLLDDPMHVMYDLYTASIAKHFPTNVLFTRKKYGVDKRYAEVFRGRFTAFVSWLAHQVIKNTSSRDR